MRNGVNIVLTPWRIWWRRLTAAWRFLRSFILAALGPAYCLAVSGALCAFGDDRDLLVTTIGMAVAYATTGIVAAELSSRGVVSETKKLFQLRLSSLFLWTLLASAQFALWRMFTNGLAGADKPVDGSTAIVGLVGLLMFHFTGWPILIYSTTGWFQLGAAMLSVAPRTKAATTSRPARKGGPR